MAIYVVDASVVAKWYVPEQHSEQAAALLEQGDTLLAPDLIVPEFGNIIWKKVRRGEFFATVGAEIIDAFLTSDSVGLRPSAVYLQGAFDLSASLQRSVYDSLYLALAVAENCRFITTDERLVNALQGSPLEPHVALLGKPTA